MKKTVKKQFVVDISKFNTSTMALRGRQSVRATFRLSEACINAISILSTQLGIKQKSVFDHLLEDVQTLKEIAGKLADTAFNHNDRVQKTFVISRRSLSVLDEISDKHNAPRDALVEYSVQRLMPIIFNERIKHEKRKKLLAEIESHFKRGQAVLSKVEDALSREDPVVIKLNQALSAYKNSLNDIAGFIEKGRVLEEFQPE